MTLKPALRDNQACYVDYTPVDYSPRDHQTLLYKKFSGKYTGKESVRESWKMIDEAIYGRRVHIPTKKTLLLLMTACIMLLGTTSGGYVEVNQIPESPMENGCWLGCKIFITEENEAINQAAAFNSRKAEYLVVWQ